MAFVSKRLVATILGILCVCVTAPTFGDEDAKAPTAPVPLNQAWQPNQAAWYGAAGYYANRGQVPAAVAVPAPVPQYTVPPLTPPVPYVAYYAVEPAVGFYVPPPLPYVYYASGSYRWSPAGLDNVRVRYWWDDGRYTIDPSHRDFHAFYR